MRQKNLDDYSPEHLKRLKNILAEVFSNLGKLSENFYLVGGLVPELLVENKLPYLPEYIGTLDIDLAINVALNNKKTFRNLYDILRRMRFEKQRSLDGAEAISHSFIRYEGGYKPVVLDFLIDDKFEPKADKLKKISPNVEAAKFKGVYLVFEDFLVRDISGVNRKDVKIKIPNIVPFLTLKAFAYADEEGGLSKDVFDIWYTIVNFKEGPVSVNGELSGYSKNRDVKSALHIIKDVFGEEASRGTQAVANILNRRYGLERARAIKEAVSPIRLLNFK